MNHADRPPSETPDELDDDVVSALREVPPVETGTRAHHIDVALEHLHPAVAPVARGRSRVLSAAAVLVVVVAVVGIVGVVTTRRHDTDHLASAGSALRETQQGDASKAPALAPATTAVADGSAADAPTPAGGTEAPTSAVPPNSPSVEATAAGPVALGSFPNDAAARHAALSRFEQDNAEKFTRTSNRDVSALPCPAPVASSPPVWSATAVVDGGERLVVVVISPTGDRVVLIADPAVCVWS